MFQKPLTLLTVLVTFTAMSGPATACSCSATTNNSAAVQKAFDLAAAVVLAKAKKISYRRIPWPGDRKAYESVTTFVAEKSWKGSHSKRFKVIGDAATSCAIGFNNAERYLLYLYWHGDSGEYTTYFCSRTKQLAHAGKDIELLDMISGKADVMR